MGIARPLWGISVLAAVAACRPAARDAPPPTNHDAAPPRARPPSRDPLDLSPGTTWHFHGTVTRTDATGGLTTQAIAWTTTVTAVEEHGGRVVYLVIGWPGDAPDLRAQATRLVVDGNVVHLTSNGEVDPDNAWFKLPLTAGDQQCDAEGVYCWSVEAAGKGWDVVFRTSPDVTRYHLERGRGVTRFEYHHNGTLDDVVLERDAE
jgi:hypothetical protein